MQILNKTALSFIVTFLVILVVSFAVIFLTGLSKDDVSPDDAVANDCIGENC